MRVDRRERATVGRVTMVRRKVAVAVAEDGVAIETKLRAEVRRRDMTGEKEEGERWEEREEDDMECKGVMRCVGGV